MADPLVRVQICGRTTVEIDGERREAGLPGHQGRLLFTYLVLHRHDPVSRDQVIFALWGDTPPRAPEAGLAALLSRLRRALSPVPLDGLRLALPVAAWVDLDGARAAIHRAESAGAGGDHPGAWAAAQTAMFVARRGFLAGEDRTWVDQVRHELDGLTLRALETYADASLHLGTTEHATAERAARELVALAPYRESAYRLLMRALVARGNDAEALQVYAGLQRRLRDELGVSPSAATRELHASLLVSDPVRARLGGA